MRVRVTSVADLAAALDWHDTPAATRAAGSAGGNDQSASFRSVGHTEIRRVNCPVWAGRSVATNILGAKYDVRFG
jgi:hypothetical protein